MTSSGSEKSKRNENFDENPRNVRRRNEEKASKKTFHEGKPCDICGDVGFEDLLPTCSNCRLSREHLYCMRVFRKEFPRIWHCEACRRQSSNEIDVFTSSQSGEVKKQNTLATESGLGKMLAHDKITNLPRAAQSLSRCIPSVTGKVKFIPTEDAVMLHSGGKPKASTMVGGSSSRPGLRRGSFGALHHRPARRTIVCPFTSSRSSLQKEPTHRSPCLPKPPTGASWQDNVHRSVSQPLAFPTQKSALASDSPRKRKIEEDRPVTELDSRRKNMIKEDRRPGIVLDSPRITKKDEDRRPQDRVGISDFTIKEKSNESGLLEFDKSTGKQHSAIPSSSLGKKDTADSFFPRTLTGCWNSKLLVTFQEEILNPPAVYATWKGSFEVVDEDCPSEVYTEFWAHPPGKVSRKAYEVSKKMPEILRFKLHPRCEQWPDIFQMDGPSNVDIALYFFPGDFSRSKEKYNGLLELIEKRDLVMQCCMDGVELLIFTSKQLPADSQRLNRQFYLWGVFRAVNVTCGHKQNMITDMVGGKDIGRGDKPMKKKHSMKQNEFQSKLHMEEEKTKRSHNLSLEKKSYESFETGGDKGNVKTTCRSGSHASKSSRDVPFNTHEKRTQVERCSVLEPLREVKKEQTMKRTNVSEHLMDAKRDYPLKLLRQMPSSTNDSDLEFPPGFSKPIKLEERHHSYDDAPFKHRSRNVFDVNSRSTRVVGVQNHSFRGM